MNGLEIFFKTLEKENSKKGKSAEIVDLKEYKMRKAMMFE